MVLDDFRDKRMYLLNEIVARSMFLEQGLELFNVLAFINTEFMLRSIRDISVP